jgi:methylphosphotriester-DNA--protein-cysteine methyltransferase|tara:strand:+ start:1314 stop:1556 length:243 start_codon:yes stop_codon:yes gene_type:complete
MNNRVLKVLEKELLELDKLSYSSIDNLMKRLAKDYQITTRELHDSFKEKHNKIPDDWAKEKRQEMSEEIILKTLRFLNRG